LHQIPTRDNSHTDWYHSHKDWMNTNMSWCSMDHSSHRNIQVDGIF
jgi:hypothetical protein